MSWPKSLRSGGIEQSLFFTDGCKVDGEFILSVDFEQVVHGDLVVSGDSAGASVDGFAGKVEVLAEVASVKGDDLVGGETVSPLHAVGDGGPDEGDGSLSGEGLAEGSLRHFSFQIFNFEFKDEVMFKRKVSVNAFFKSGDIQHTKVCFKGVAASGGRYCPQGVTGIEFEFDPLGCPEKEREFFKGEGRIAVCAAALPSHYGRSEVDPSDIIQGFNFWQLDLFFFGRIRLFDRWRWNPAVLVCQGEVDSLADGVFEKEAGLFKGRFVCHALFHIQL